MTTVVPVSPKPRFSARKSAAVSPIVVARILMIQKKIVTSGTLLNTISTVTGGRLFEFMCHLSLLTWSRPAVARCGQVDVPWVS